MSYKTPALHTFSWQQPVKDKDLTAPPGGETKGDRYIVASGGTDAWSGKDNQIATYNGSGWDFTVPTEGMITWVQDEDVYYKYISAWSVLLASDLMKVSDTRHFVGTFTRSTTTATGTQEITGIGFTPKVIIFHACIHNGVGKNSWGLDDNVTNICIWDNYQTTANTYAASEAASIRIRQGGSSAYEYYGTISTLDVDGFTISWTKGASSPNGETITVNYIAFK